MKIDENACTACEVCLPYCPVGVISMEDVAVIDQDECTECGVCLRSGVCPVDAFIYETPPWPRSLRAIFSNPLEVFKETGVAGRGTEEMKTNDVTGRFKRGWVGIGIEMGRPGTGCRFRDVDKVARAMAKLGAHFEPKNPLTFLMEDVSTGKLKEEILNEKVLSAIIECAFPAEKLKDVIDSLDAVAKEVDCVFSTDCITRAEPDGSLPVEKLLKDLGIPYYINTKNNVGLGRPLVEGDN